MQYIYIKDGIVWDMLLTLQEPSMNKIVSNQFISRINTCQLGIIARETELLVEENLNY